MWSCAWCQRSLHLPSHFKQLSQQGAVFKRSTPVHIHRLHRRSLFQHTSAQLCPHLPHLHWLDAHTWDGAILLRSNPQPLRLNLTRLEKCEAFGNVTHWIECQAYNFPAFSSLYVLRGRGKGVKLRMSINHAAEEDKDELFQCMQIGHLITLN